MRLKTLALLLFATAAMLPARSDEAGHTWPVVIAFHAGTDAAAADRILLDLDIQRIDHPDLLPSERMARLSATQWQWLRARPEVARTFRASPDLSDGSPVHACGGPAVERTKSGALAASALEGWSRDRNGLVELSWSLRGVPEYLSPEETSAALERALAEWSRHAALKFTRTSHVRAYRSIDFLFGAGDHGDPYPFQGRNGVLAHGFYPAGMNPEPIAGDVHLNADETWSHSGGRDVYSVALHEIGHALGLGHSETPGSVMYPYFRTFDGLQPEDIESILQLYGPPVTPVTPVTHTPVSISAALPRWLPDGSVELTGTVSGGSGEVTVYWASVQSGGSTTGRNWTLVIPLPTGRDTITVTAVDETGAQSSTRISLVGEEPGTPASPGVPATSFDKQPPVVRISSPAASLIATSADRMRVSGSARDNVGVEGVTWSSGGASGTASGAGSWSFEVDLIPGDNYVVVTARDAAGNAGRAAVLITRR